MFLKAYIYSAIANNKIYNKTLDVKIIFGFRYGCRIAHYNILNDLWIVNPGLSVLFSNKLKSFIDTYL